MTEQPSVPVPEQPARQQITVYEGEAAKKKNEQYLLSLKSKDVEPRDRTLPIHFCIEGDKTLFIDESGPEVRVLEVNDPVIASEMKIIFQQFVQSSSVRQEMESRRRGSKVSLSLIRHGEAADQSKEAQLSEKGKLQAEVAAYQLLFDIWSKGGGLLKFYHSPTLRAGQTLERIKSVVDRVVASSPASSVKLYKPRTRKQIEAPGVLGALMKQGIPYEQTVQHWLMNPTSVEGKTPADIFGILKPFLELGQKYAERLPVSAPHFFQAAVTHEVPQAALMYTVTEGRTLDQIGGGMRNGESIMVEFRPGQQYANIHFRSADYRLPLDVKKSGQKRS